MSGRSPAGAGCRDGARCTFQPLAGDRPRSMHKFAPQQPACLPSVPRWPAHRWPAPILNRCQASSSSLSPGSVGDSTPSSLDSGAAAVAGTRIREAVGQEELRAVAHLRAEAYYAEEPYSRFTTTFKRQFAEQELSSLKLRTSPGRTGCPSCVCVVAVDESSGEVKGCVDVRPPATVAGDPPKGVTNGDRHAAYLLNVVVSNDLRRRGLGAALVGAAAQLCERRWRAQRLYTHVDAQNEVATSLYVKCGFESRACELPRTANGATATKLGEQLLMVLALQPPTTA